MKLSSLQHCENGTAEELPENAGNRYFPHPPPSPCLLASCMPKLSHFLCSLTPSVSHAAEWLLYVAFSASEST